MSLSWKVVYGYMASHITLFVTVSLPFNVMFAA